MHRVTREFSFDASHNLPRHKGKCHRVHGHTWVVKITCCGSLNVSGPESGMVIDYGRIKEAMAPIIEKLDHYHLNNIPGLANPTSEILAKWIYDKAKPHFHEMLESVEVMESPGSSCVYYE